MKPIKIVLISLITIFLIFVIAFFLSEEKPHQYFDPQNPDNIYTITADDNYFYVGCRYSKNNTSNQKCFKGIIASSPIDLHQFTNKRVKLQGKFINTTFDKVLCPIDNCHRSSSRNGLQALEITSISLAE